MRRVSVSIAVTSLAAALLVPAGPASATHRPAAAAGIPAVGVRTAPRPTRPAVNQATETIAGLERALTGAPLSALKLPPLIKWRLSQFRSGSNRPCR